MNVSADTNFPIMPSQASHMSFSGRGREFLKLLIIGSLFQIPTFGFYRFWLTTKLRRHLWANTRIQGEAFEYTGTAKELLIGFLIALAVLVPLYLAYFIVSIMAEEKYAFASLPLIVVMYVLAHFGSYRARRYRATRTMFRGVRFWMTGSGWSYALRAVLWDIATILSLGFALPWAMASLERYRMRHTYFGNMKGDFIGTGWALFKRGWWVWALEVVALIVGSGLVLLTMSPAGMKYFPHAASALQKGKAGGIGAAVGIIIGLWPLAMAIFTRWHIDGLRFGEVELSNHLRLNAFYGLYCRLIVSSAGFVIAFAAIAGGLVFVISRFLHNASEAVDDKSLNSTSIGIMALAALGYLIASLGLGVLQRYFFGRGLWAMVVSTTMVSNLDAADAALASGQLSGTLGEGLADALDFNVGL